jgi:hypothetical protein
MKYLWLSCGLTLLLGTTASQADDPKPKKAEDMPTSYEIPYRLTDSQHVLVRVKFNGKGPFNFILDTGAPALIMSEKVAAKLNLEPDRKGWIAFDKFEIEGGLKMDNVKGLAIDMFQLKGMNTLGLAGVELHGVIGYNILAKYKIQYDFTEPKLLWTPLQFDPPEIKRLGGGEGNNSQGGLEMIGEVIQLLGPLLGMKANFDVKPRGFLGIELEDKDGAVVVKSVLANSPADKGGLKAGDQIELARNYDIEEIRDMFKAVDKLTVGAKLKLKVRRNNERQELTIELGRGL